MKSSDILRPFDLKTYRQRRHQLVLRLSKIEKDFVALFWSGSELIRNSDCHYRFRAHSDFLYLTGFSEPETLIVFFSKNGKSKSAIGLRPRDLTKSRGSEIWEGERVGVERAPKILGFDEAFDIHQMQDFVRLKMQEVPTVFWRFGEFPQLDTRFIQLASEFRNNRKSGGAVVNWKDSATELHHMRKKKSSEEVAAMRRSAVLSSLGHIRAMETIREGQVEYQVATEAEREFFRHGAQAVAYNSICAAGNNACTLHYAANNQRIKKGSLLLMDAAGELDGYAADITRSFPANGRFSKEQGEVYGWVLKAQLAAIRAVKPGVPWMKPHRTAIRILSEGLSKMGIIKKTPAKILKDKLWHEYMPHGTSHWLGLDVHDCGPYFDEDGKELKLEVGNVLTVEPGLYFRKDQTAVPKKYRGIGVRIEDDVLVTRSGHEVLTAACPKTIEEIEALRAPCL